MVMFVVTPIVEMGGGGDLAESVVMTQQVPMVAMVVVVATVM